MTYARLLLQFLVVPMVALAFLVLRARFQQKRSGMSAWQGRSPYVVLAALTCVAILYTTPWDNHLIATGVWWYRPTLVSGVTFGQIPLEELIFFPLQTLFIGLWCLWLAPRLATAGRSLSTAASSGAGDMIRGAGAPNKVRLISAVVGGCLWLSALVVLRLAWLPGTYLGWELVWGLPPLILQLGLGGDILWRYRRLLAVAFVPAVFYLSAVDALAIHAGIWTIAPHQSLGVLLGGQLPLEEVIFFALTSALVAFGLVLGVAAESRVRLHAYLALLAVSPGQSRPSDRREEDAHPNSQLHCAPQPISSAKGRRRLRQGGLSLRAHHPPRRHLHLRLRSSDGPHEEAWERDDAN